MNTSWFADLLDPRVALRDPFLLFEVPDVAMRGATSSAKGPPGDRPSGAWWLAAALPSAVAIVWSSEAEAPRDPGPAAAAGLTPEAMDQSGLREIMLGDLLARGIGARRDADRASACFALAVEKGNRGAATRLATLPMATEQPASLVSCRQRPAQR